MKRDLAMAYGVKKKAPKKYAKGGQIPPSAKTEARPSADEQDMSELSRNRGNKPAKDDSWTSNVTVKQAQKPSITKLSRPKMVGSDAFSVRSRDMRDDEADMGDRLPPETDTAQPNKRDDEMDAKASGHKLRDTEREHSNGKKPYNEDVEHDDTTDQAEPDMKKTQSYAAGGKVIDEDAMDLRLRDDESDLMIHDDPSEDEGDGDAHSLNEVDGNRQGADPDMEREHSNGRMPYAEGGLAHEMDDQDTSEMEEEHHSSIADAIMANRDRMHAEIDSGSRDLDAAARYASGGTVASGSRDMSMYEGGQVPNHDDGEADIMENGREHPNGYYPRNEDEVLKENYMDDMEDVSQPEDSNETGDERESMRSDRHDMVDKIMKKRKQR